MTDVGLGRHGCHVIEYELPSYSVKRYSQIVSEKRNFSDTCIVHHPEKKLNMETVDSQLTNHSSFTLDAFIFY